MPQISKCLLFLFVVAFTLEPARADHPIMGFLMTNLSDADSTKFESEIGSIYAADLIENTTNFVLKMFNQLDSGAKNYDTVMVVVESFNASKIPYAQASTVGYTIKMNWDYILNYKGNKKDEFTSIMYRETTHVWQWNGKGKAPIGLLNGIADYARLTAGWPAKNWPKKGSGSSWKQSSVITAYFLQYCNGLRDGFVANLNAMMKNHRYRDSYFQTLLGKSVDQLWYEYKMKYKSQ